MRRKNLKLLIKWRRERKKDNKRMNEKLNEIKNIWNKYNKNHKLIIF